jgi:hypothetical protein
MQNPQEMTSSAYQSGPSAYSEVKAAPYILVEGMETKEDLGGQNRVRRSPDLSSSKASVSHMSTRLKTCSHNGSKGDETGAIHLSRCSEIDWRALQSTASVTSKIKVTYSATEKPYYTR